MAGEGRYPFKLGSVTSVFGIRPGDLDEADFTALTAWEFEPAPGLVTGALPLVGRGPGMALAGNGGGLAGNAGVRR